MIKIIILSIILLAIGFLMLATRIILDKYVFHRKGKFPNTSVGKNPALRKLGITCAKHDEQQCFSNLKNGFTNNSTGCSCG